MNKKDSEQTDPAHNPKTPPSDAVINQHQESAHDGNPQHEPTDNKLREAIIGLKNWVKEGWNKTGFAQRIEIGLAGIVAAATITYVIVASLQLGAMNRTNNLTQQSLRLARLNLRLERRPFVAIVDFAPQVLMAEGTLSAKVRNYGASPARGVYAYGVFKQNQRNWRDKTCGGQNKTMDIETAGVAIFQGSDGNIEIPIEASSITSPIRPYPAVCLTFMDMQGPFHFFDDPKQGPPCSPYSIKHLYTVVPANGKLEFTKIYTSVEGAEPQIDPRQRCYGE